MLFMVPCVTNSAGKLQPCSRVSWFWDPPPLLPSQGHTATAASAMWTPWGRMHWRTLRDTGGRKRMAIATSEPLCEWPDLHFRGLASISPGFFFSSQNRPVIIDWESTLEKEDVFTWRGWVGSSTKMIWSCAGFWWRRNGHSRNSGLSAPTQNTSGSRAWWRLWTREWQSRIR